MNTSMLRTRWAAIGAAVAVTLGAGGIGLVSATSPTGATAYVPITPCRLVDTRPAPDTVGARASALAADDTFTVSAHGSNGNCTGASAIPTTATGLQLNVTGVNASTGTFLTIFPTGAPQPTSSSLNPVPNAAVPNAVTTGLSSGGQFSIFNKFGSVNVIVDVVGYYTDHDHDDRYVKKTDLFIVPSQGDQDLDITSPSAISLGGSFSTVMRSVTVTAPVGGIIKADASFTAMGTTPGQTTVGTCSVTPLNDTEASTETSFSVAHDEFEAVSITRTLAVSGGTVTLKLLCRTNSGLLAPRSMKVTDSALNATFIPGFPPG